MPRDSITLGLSGYRIDCIRGGNPVIMDVSFSLAWRLDEDSNLGPSG